MPLIIDGDFKLGKELMKEDRKRRMNAIRKLERQHAKLNVTPPVSELNQLEALRKKIPFCSVTETLPAKLDNGLIINAKLLQAFMKKLRGFQYKFTITDDSLILHYGKRHGTWTGKLELCDISTHFKGFTDIPKLEISTEFCDE